MVEFEALSKTFRRFGEIECRGASALYEHLSFSIAQDEQLLALAAHSRPGQPAPNLLFASVHFLLLQGHPSPLARFYRSLTVDPLPPEEAYPAFREFCMQNSPVLEPLLASRYVQTNEVRRSAYLFLAFSLISRLAAGRPLALIEIGASAGLNLLCDRYGYRYSYRDGYRDRDYGQFGDRQSPVQIECTLRGDKLPPLPVDNLLVTYRAGLDLNPIDVKDDEQVAWLAALVWPENVDRAQTLHRAVDIARRNPPMLIKGNAMELLPAAIRAAPPEAALCVFHTHTIYQLSPVDRDRLSADLAEHAAARGSFFRVSAEELASPEVKLELTVWLDGRVDRRVLANCHAHGQWIEWLDDRV